MSFLQLQHALGNLFSLLLKPVLKKLHFSITLEEESGGLISLSVNHIVS